MKKRTEYFILILGILIALLVVFSISIERKHTTGLFFSEFHVRDALVPDYRKKL